MVDQTRIIQAGLEALATIDVLAGVLQRLRPAESDTAGPPFTIISNGEIPDAVERLCHAQALAYACLFDTGNRSSESPRHTRLRLERVALVKKVCGQNDFPNLRQRGFRNAVAHFDERYLKMLCDHAEGQIVQDLALSNNDAINIGRNPEKRMIRVLLYDRDTIYLFGESIQILPLQAEAQAVLKAFSATSPHNSIART